MKLVPLSYNVRSLFVRRSSTLLTIVSIAATVAVLAGVLSLRSGFQSLFADGGRTDLAVFLRPGATSEGESAFSHDRVDQLVKSLGEIAVDDAGRPLASAETFLALRLRKLDGGETNVPIRGVQPRTFDLRANEVRFVAGRPFAQGQDEIVVGSGLVERMRGCRLGDVLVVNTTPFHVVGVFENDGPFDSEIWGDAERMMEALERRNYSRVIAQIVPGTDMEALAERLADDKNVPAKVLTERDYLLSQTTNLTLTLSWLGWGLASIMGIAAVFTGMNTMLAALTARSHEIGILLSMGFRPFAIFFSFLFEAVLLSLLGGVLGCVLALPLHGIRTGTTNFDTFTEVAFAFRVTPDVLVQAVLFALALGLVGGAWPSWRAARLAPTHALRRG